MIALPGRSLFAMTGVAWGTNRRGPQAFSRFCRQP